MTKRCVYQTCETTSTTPGRTLFGFPLKEPERLMKWLVLTGCSPTDLTESVRYVCDLHFNPIYISNNSRRKILLGQAVPHSNYEISTKPDLVADADTTEPVNPLEYEHEVSIEFVDETGETEEHEEEDSVPSEHGEAEDELRDGGHLMRKRRRDSYQHTEEEETVSASEINVSNRSEVAYESSNKRRIIESVSSVPEKRARVKPIAQQPPALSPNATIKVINGVSYVQMPKHVYLAEQQIARDELMYWKSLVRTFKEQLDEVEF